MHKFDYSETTRQTMVPEVVSLLMTVQEYRGRMQVYRDGKPAVLEKLREVARVQSTAASNRIEGVVTTNARLKALMQQTTEPRNRSEEEIAGYRDVLNTIHENYRMIPLQPSIILQLHRDLYAYNGRGGEWKHTDNIIAETDARGRQRVRFEPVQAFQTPEAMECLCNAYRRKKQEGAVESLLLVPLFILDFLCIHPFPDGNGRMSRLLTTLLLNRSGYDVGRFISLEKLIDDAKDGYYGALQDSSEGWHENRGNYVPFVRYFMGILIKAYTELEARVKDAVPKSMRKPERVKALFDTALSPLSKAAPPPILEGSADLDGLADTHRSMRRDRSTGAAVIPQPYSAAMVILSARVRKYSVDQCCREAGSLSKLAIPLFIAYHPFQVQQVVVFLVGCLGACMDEVGIPARQLIRIRTQVVLRIGARGPRRLQPQPRRGKDEVA